MATPTVTTLSGQSLSIDLLTRDFEGFRADALELADSVAPDWTDRSELDIGVTIVEGLSFMSDNLSYYQDRVGNECLWPSIQQRRSIIEQSKMIDYALRAAVSAQVDMTFITSEAGTVTAGTAIDVDTQDGSDPATFELEEEFVAPGAGTFTGIFAINGTTVTETIGSSTGQAAQKFTLNQSPLALNSDGGSSLRVSVDEGSGAELWSEVQNFLVSQPTDKVYRVEIDETDIITVIFSDGVNGQVPSGGTNNITGVYRVGGGIAGNSVGPNKLTKLGGSFSFVTSITNPAQPNGGRDKESIEEAKVLGPASLSALNRAVTHADYKFHAESIGGVSQALAFNGLGRYEEVIAIAAAGSNPIPTGTWDSFTELGTGLIGDVGTLITSVKTAPVIIQVVPAILAELNLDIDVFLFPTTRRSDAQKFVTDAIEETYDSNNISFGQTLPISLVSDVVEDVNGVDYVDVKRHQRQPAARPETSYATDISFTNFIIGENTTRDRWTVQFINATTFSVIGESVGAQINTGTVGTTYTVDDGTFSFDTVAGITAPSGIERFELITTPFIGNVFLDPDEVLSLISGVSGPTFGLTLIGGLG